MLKEILEDLNRNDESIENYKNSKFIYKNKIIEDFESLKKNELIEIYDIYKNGIKKRDLKFYFKKPKLLSYYCIHLILCKNNKNIKENVEKINNVINPLINNYLNYDLFNGIIVFNSHYIFYKLNIKENILLNVLYFLYNYNITKRDKKYKNLYKLYNLTYFNQDIFLINFKNRYELAFRVKSIDL